MGVEISRRYTRLFDEAETYYQWGLALQRLGDRSPANEKRDAALAHPPAHRHRGALAGVGAARGVFGA